MVRCLALAETLAGRGWDCQIAATPETVSTVPQVTRSGLPVLALNGDPGAEASALRNALPEGCDWLIVDHYGRGGGFESACRSWVGRILVLDDAPTRAHDADLLVDATPGRRADDWRPRVPAGCKTICGPAYAPLRPQFATARAAAISRRERDTALRRVLISVGGTDPRGAGRRALQGVIASGLELRVDIVSGTAASENVELTRLAAGVRGEVRLHSDVHDMASLISDADIAIGAAGSSSWERCTLGLPSVVMITADNQRETASALAESGAAISLGEVAEVRGGDLGKTLRHLAEDPEELRAMARAAALLCDGRGAARVADQIEPPVIEGFPVTLRPAGLKDAGIMLEWQREPGIRRHFRNPDPPSDTEHRRWFATRTRDPGCLLNVVEHGDAPAGVLRLDRRGTPADRPCYEVSILVSHAHQGKGLGRAALTLARRLVPEAWLVADINRGNAPSQALFRGVGFETSDGRTYRLAPTD